MKRALPLAAALAFLACKERPPQPEVAGRSLGQALEAGAPAWTAQPPRIVSRGGKRYAVAVGSVDGVSSKALAHAAAQERARAELSKLLASRKVVGAAVTRSFEAPSGRVFVELELALR